MWKIGRYLRELAEAKEKNKWITLRTDIPLKSLFIQMDGDFPSHRQAYEYSPRFYNDA